MTILRTPNLDDLDFILRVDLEDEGVDSAYRDEWGEAEFGEHRRLVESFVTDSNKGGMIAETPDGKSVGLILWRFRNCKTEDLQPGHLFREIEAELPANGAFCELYQLWVDPSFRRQSIATTLKLAAQEAALRYGVSMIYTHTEERNEHVLELNRKLGYRVVRRGPIWDDIVRISLVKDLPA